MNTLIRVWIESIKVNGQWQFYDGSLMLHVCHIEMSRGPEEVHVRTRVQYSTNLYYQNGVNEDLFHYSCEYSKLSAIYIQLAKKEILKF